MKRPKFPTLLHVTYEQGADGTDPWLQAREGGVAFDTDIEDARPCAIYRLETVGVVAVQRRFIPKKARR